MKMMITKEDVLQVAYSLKFRELTEKEIDWILLCYEDAQRQDPSGTWNLVVEDLIYQLKPGTFDQLGYEQTQPEPGDDDFDNPRFGEDASTDDCWFDYEGDVPPINHFHTDGDGDDDTLLNFMG